MIKILNNFSYTWKIKFNFFIIGAADLPDGGDKASVKGCCVEAGVPNLCIGLCTPGQSVARSLGNRITSCTEYDEDIEKCWEQSIPTPDKIGELVMQFSLASVPLIYPILLLIK